MRQVHRGLLLGALVCAAPVPSLAGAAGPAVTHLETNAAAALLGLDDRAPRFTWRIADDRRGVMQASFRVRVASSAERLRRGEADLWDSGVVHTSDPWAIYAGAPLASRSRYFWSVQVTVTPGAVAASSDPAWFETALLAPSDWKARWIGGPPRAMTLSPEEGAGDDAAIRAAGEFCRPVAWLTTGFAARRIPNNQGECRELRPAPMLRRSFRVGRRVTRARAYWSGLAYGHLTLNGEPISESVLDPGFTDYGQTVLYRTHDVTSLVRAGENVLAAELGSGQFDGATRTWDWGWDQAEWRAAPQLILQLHLAYDDGSEQVVLSDGSWKASVDGPRRYDSYYLGETYDARREIGGWDRPGFDDARWAPAREVAAPQGALRAQAHEAIAIVSERPPGDRIDPAPGVILYDVGQNLTGWAVLSVQAPAGTAIEIFYSEKRGLDGRASTAGNDLVFGQLQTDYYVARGEGTERWAPRFSYKGFQYVQVTGPGGAPLPAGVSVAVERVQQVRSALVRTSTFETDRPTLNRIHANTVWAVQNNFHGIITDTPVYEKNGWTGDAQLTAGTASLLFDTERLYRKLFQDMRDAQTEEGQVPLLAPSNENYGYVGKPAFKPVDCCGATPAWDAFWFVVPWESYQRHGDRRALEATFPAMQRYLDQWVPRWTGRDGDAWAHTLTAGLGDWVPPKDVPTVNALSSTAYYAHLTRIAADAARALGRADEAARYDALFRRIRDDFNARFLSPDGVYRERAEDPFVQTAQILPLAFGLVPDARRAALAATLAADVVQARGGNAFVGVLGARYVLPVLTAGGRLDAAVTAVTQIDEPSWGYWTDVAGFTALGEHWPADTRSRDHHFFGTVVQWLYEDLAGIRPAAPGYAVIECAPAVPAAGVGSVSASYESVRGTIESRWRRDERGLELEVLVPANATARVRVPASSPDAVSADPAAVLAPEAAGGPGAVVYRVGSGRYRFHVRAGR